MRLISGDGERRLGNLSSGDRDLGLSIKSDRILPPPPLSLSQPIGAKSSCGWRLGGDMRFLGDTI